MKKTTTNLLKNSIAAILLAAIFICVPAVPSAADIEKTGLSADDTGQSESKTMSTAESKEKSAKNVVIPKKSPTQAIKDLDAKLDDFNTGKNLTKAQEEQNKKLKMDIIHGTFDIRELSKLALAKHWNGLTAEQRNHFVDLMVSLLEEKALFSKEQSAAKSKEGGKYNVLYKGYKNIGDRKDKAFVRTKVVIPSENIDINLNYKLKAQDGDWKIYDVIVDEASLVSNYKYQFNSIITKHGYDELVNRMTRKLDEIKTDREKKS